MTTDGPAGRGAVQAGEIDAWLGRAYPVLLGGDAAAALALFCGDFAERIGAPLVRLLRRDAGELQAEAESSDCELWSELQRVPERLDVRIGGQGPASAALAAGAPVALDAGDDLLAVWRAPLQRERIARVLAWPLAAACGARVLEIFVRHDGVGVDDAPAQRIRAALVRLLDDSDGLQRKNLLAAALESSGNAAFATDLAGTIAWSNAAHQRLSGFAPAELVGSRPRFLKPGQQGLAYYRELWDTLRSGRTWSGHTVDRDRRGESYVIQQTISPVLQAGRVTHYIAIQSGPAHGQPDGAEG